MQNRVCFEYGNVYEHKMTWNEERRSIMAAVGLPSTLKDHGSRWRHDCFKNRHPSRLLVEISLQVQQFILLDCTAVLICLFPFCWSYALQLSLQEGSGVAFVYCRRDSGHRSTRGGQLSSDFLATADQIPEAERREAEWSTCAISGEPLQEPIVACHLGRLWVCLTKGIVHTFFFVCLRCLGYCTMEQEEMILLDWGMSNYSPMMVWGHFHISPDTTRIACSTSSCLARASFQTRRRRCVRMTSFTMFLNCSWLTFWFMAGTVPEFK